jgi:hypothetical protein
MERPPYELWPSNFLWRNKELNSMLMDKRGFLKKDEKAINMYDQLYTRLLRENFDEDEALRYEAMRPFREFIMNNYRPAEPKLYVARNNRITHKIFGEQRVFQLKDSAAK